MDVFVLAGQSNMAGRGGVRRSEYESKFDGKRPNEYDSYVGAHIRAFSDARGWVRAEDPLHQEVDCRKACGVGPGLMFSQRLITDGAASSVGLVPCAVGGTGIDAWRPGEGLYVGMVERTRRALHDAPTDSKLAAILWYQGESDCDTRERAESWRSKFEDMTAQLRYSERTSYAHVPEVAVTCRESPTTMFAATVRAAQHALRLPRLQTVDAQGLELQEDGLHLTTKAQVQLGTRLAEAYIDHFAAFLAA